MTQLPNRGILSFMYERTPTHHHRGIDLVAPLGTPVFAVGSGYVTHADERLEPGFSGYGGHVAIQARDGTHHLYAHLDEVDVAPGQYVRRGTRLGTVGRTCFTSSEPHRMCGGAHLHFEVSPTPYPQHSEAPRLDPVAYLNARGAHPLVEQRFPWGLVVAGGGALAIGLALQRG